MSNFVWVSKAPAHVSNMRPLTCDILQSDRSRGLEIQKKVERGEPLSDDEFPKQIFGQSDAPERSYNFPDFFAGSIFWVVSKAAADVIQEFNLGSGALRPVKILRLRLTKGSSSKSVALSKIEPSEGISTDGAHIDYFSPIYCGRV